MICEFLMLFCAFGTETINAQIIASGGLYRLRNQCSNKLLEIRSDNQIDGAPASQWTERNAPSQLWKVEATDNGFYRLTAQHSQKVLGINGLGEGANAVQQTWQEGAPGQQWKLISQGGGYFKLESGQAAGKLLTVAWASKANGTFLKIYGNNDLCSQRWRLETNSNSQIIFNSQTPISNNVSDNRSHELGLKFFADTDGEIRALRYWKAAGESGSHIGRIWSATGALLRSVGFNNETGSGWQEATLATPLAISANMIYTVSVNANSHYVLTASALDGSLQSGNIRTIADDNNGVVGEIGTFPTDSNQNSNYFRDVRFVPDNPVVAPTTCLASPNARPVTDFGAFTPNLNNPATVAANTITLNRAITDVGNAGGGTICLPAGTFYLAPPQLTGNYVTSILIDKNNITLWGAGRDASQGGTKLRTRSDFSVINGNVVRGVGLWIRGTSVENNPRQNIVLRDFELDGGAGFTGNFGFPADPATGDGWDLSHKGIILSADEWVTNVTLKNVWVHSYRGEVIYAGGINLGRVLLDRVKSEDTNASTYNMTAEATVLNSEFGRSRFWIEIGTIFTGKSGTFINNYFHDANVDSAVVLAQGDLSVQPYRFEGNRFDRCPGSSFLFGGGVGGPVLIRGNSFKQCGGLITTYAPNPYPQARPENQNITFENNRMTDGGWLAYFLAIGQNITIRNNRVVNTTGNPGATTAVSYCCSNLQNVLIENNTFENTRTPEQSADVNAGERPLFRGNNYLNPEIRELQGFVIISNAAPTVRTVYEESFIQATQPNVVVQLLTGNYPDGQEVSFTGGSTANPVRFVTGAATYQVNAERRLTGAQTLKLRFNRAQNKWLETSFQ